MFNRLKFPAVALLFVLLSGCNKDRDRYEYSPPPPPPIIVQPSNAYVPPTVPGVATNGTQPEIRVAVQKDATSIRIGAPSSGAKIVVNGTPWKQLPANAIVNVTYANGSLALEGQPVSGNSIRFDTFSPDAFIKVADKDASTMVVVSHPPSRTGLLAVALLNMEDYLTGVLAGEVPYDRWHPEAMKAQAIVSRTFALYEIKARSGDTYDVDSTMMSQVFKGANFRSVPALTTAVNATRGMVLTSGGAMFPAYFHSTCGGHTEAAGGIFPDHAGVRPLGGVKCPYCTISPSYRWRASYTKESIAVKLREKIPTLGKIESLTFSDAKGAPVGDPGSEPRRAQTVTIKHSAGTSTMQGNVFRLAVGPAALKSLLFVSVSDKGDSLDISGGGYGHGVGLCQYGSQGMAQSGEPYLRILGLYFPGAALTKMY